MIRKNKKQKYITEVVGYTEKGVGPDPALAASTIAGIIPLKGETKRNRPFLPTTTHNTT